MSKKKAKKHAMRAAREARRLAEEQRSTGPHAAVPDPLPLRDEEDAGLATGEGGVFYAFNTGPDEPAPALELPVADTATAGPPPTQEPSAPDELPALRHRPGGVLPAPMPGASPLVAARDVLSRLSGAGLCYGAPVSVEGRTVIPVARVTTRGGMGYGGERSPGEGGGGGGGMLRAAPTGYIEVTAAGVSYERIAGGRGAGVAAGAAVIAGVAAGIAGAAMAGRRRRPPTGLARISWRLRP